VGSDGYSSEHGTVTYPSPASDCERVNMTGVGVGQSPIPPHLSGSSELALALHSNESVSLTRFSSSFSRSQGMVQLIASLYLQSPYTPPPAFKYSEADTHSSPHPQLPQEYPPYNMTTYGGEYSHPHVNGYSPSAYPSTFDSTDGGVACPQPVPSPHPVDDYVAASGYT
jgi:hypothetical protein